MIRNSPGQRHADRYALPANEWTWLRYPDGRPTGHAVHTGQLIYDRDHGGQDGRLRLDQHEIFTVTWGADAGSRMVFHRGGLGYADRYNVHYGHVLLSDLASPVGHPIASGGDRGDPSRGHAVHALRVTAVDPRMYYKPGDVNPGSTWITYGDIGARFGGEVHYAPLLWSFLNVGGGGMLRAVLPDWLPIILCDVPRIKARSYDSRGRHNGWVWGAYVRAYHLYGWIVYAHQIGDSVRVVHHTRAVHA